MRKIKKEEHEKKIQKKTRFVPTYFNCGKKGHMKSYCPLLNKASKKFRKS